MLDVEQFVYTAADINGRKGYQVVAKSSGISDKTIDQLESYMYPVGVLPGTFLESRSLIFLDDGLVVYSRIKNAGIGYDGRANTIYNHSFVFTLEGFEAHGYDSRMLDGFFLDGRAASGRLPTLSVELARPIPRSAAGIADVMLEDVLTALFEGKKIVLLETDVELPQRILSLVPKPLRQISFSTLVVEPSRQPRYRLVLESGRNMGAFGNGFAVIQEKDGPPPPPKTDFGRAIRYYAALIRSGNHQKIDDLWRQFESIASGDYKDRLVLLASYFQYAEARDEDERVLHAGNVVNALKKLDHDTFSHYFWKVSGSLSTHAMSEGMAHGRINHVMPVRDVRSSHAKPRTAPKQHQSVEASHRQ